MPRNWFNRSLPLPKVQRAAYDLHEDRIQTMRLARLCPIGIQECLPKDIHMFSHDAFLRLAPLKYPILQKLNLNMASFFVPDRLILGEDKAVELFRSLEPSDALIPKLKLVNDGIFDYPGMAFSPNGLLDYFGIQADLSPQGVPQGGYVIIPNPIPIFQYLLILRDYYMDEQIDESLIAAVDTLLEAYKAVPLGGTLEIGAGVSPIPAVDQAFQDVVMPFHVRKYRDYYTSGLPTPQRGDDVYIMNPATLIDSSGDKARLFAYNGSAIQTFGAGEPGTTPLTNLDTLGFDTTVRDLLTKMAYQRFKNVLNQFGADRYNEFLAGNFGVINQDVRLQRAECIGRSRGIFQISEVIQQSATEATSPLGSYAGRGIAGKRTRNFRYHVNEHGFLFHLVSVVPDQGYMSGAPRWYFKESGLDFALPQFNNVGEQPIYKGELYLNALDSSDNKDDFAYIPRYSEYRSGRNYASAGMRQSPFTAWHLYEAFDHSVALNGEFLEANDADRIFNLVDPTSVQNIVGVFHSYHVAFRPISYNPK